MKLCVETKMRVARSASRVFEAWVDPAKMAQYFISRGSGRLEAGSTVTWYWSDHDGAELAIEVKRLEQDRHLTFVWAATKKPTTVTVDFEPAPDGATEIAVKEEGWDSDAAGIASYGQQMQGWVHMLSCLKAYLEHGINLRKDRFEGS
jgi:uncharacterized protein YndB with AHSA1/START domain